MGTRTKFVYYAKECRDTDKSPGHCSYKKEPEVRNFDARRVSKSILNEILSEIHKVNHIRPSLPCKIIRIAREIPKQKVKMPEPKTESNQLNKASSMSSLIIWNISKAIEINPCLDLKGSIKAAKQRLDSDARDFSTVSEKHPEQQHLLCALLAWQQLGHSDADSLYRFVKPKLSEMSCAAKCESMRKSNYKDPICNRRPTNSTNVYRNPVVFKNCKPSDDGSFGSHTSGPIVALPSAPKLIMRIANESGSCCRSPASPNTRLAQDVRRPEKDTLNKLDAVCCMNTQCAETLASLDQKTNELRTRAFQLAQQESNRVKLLERAEGAWKDLEAGYQRRLASEQDNGKQLEKKIDNLRKERNTFKTSSKTMTEDLARRKEAAEKVRLKLTKLEKEVCDIASTKLRLSEEAAKGEASLAEELAKIVQYERDLKFNEEQARRKYEALMNEADTTRALACETERAMRAELAALRDQLENVSKQLLMEDADNLKTKVEHDQLRSEKKDLIEDLEGCKASCDQKMQKHLDELKKKKEKLLELQEQVLDCRCKMPTDVTVQVKRTPSLAAICRCVPEDNMLESCSCTSLRSRLLSNLLSDLFGGLQAELGSAGYQMPCQMLKCLEDSHSWDRPSATKTNLRNFFSKLLKSELDIAIATSIENYHARWVGASCADAPKIEPTLDDDLKEGWQERAIERRAKQLANKLVENLYQERAEEMEQRAKEIISGVQPCECPSPPSPRGGYCKTSEQFKTNSQPKHTALLPCLVSPISPFNPATTATTVYRQAIETPPAFWKKTIQDVSQLKLQIEDLKKESIKKEDLKVMEENISKIVRETSVIENEDPLTRDTSDFYGESVKKEKKSGGVSRDESPKTSNQNKFGTAKRKEGKSLSKKGSTNEKPTKQSKKQVHGQSYAVNICLGEPQKNTKSLQNAQLNNSDRPTWKQNSLKDILPQTSTVKQIKPININLLSPELQENGSKSSVLCDSDCKCFHKIPSNTSIDRLLQTLVSWKYDLVPQEKSIKDIKRSSSKYSKTAIKETLSKLNQNGSKKYFSISTTSNNKNQVNDSNLNNDTHSMKADQKDRSFLKQPITTESEYMGTVYLDKSHENVCKCVANMESKKNNSHKKYEDSKKNIPFQCINTHTCDCKIYQGIQRDHKKSQTEELNLQIQSNQCQVALSKDNPDFCELQHGPKNSIYINNHNETKQKSNINNVPQKTELYSNSSEYYIKFLGATLDDLSSDKIKKIKPDDYDTAGLLLPKDKHAEQPRFPKTLSNIEQPNSLMKPNILTRERQDQSKFNDSTKCECKAKFEELTSFMTNFLDNKLRENSHKDDVIDPKSFKYTADNTIESCVCCSGVNKGDSRELEVNAFHLLEDHIKEKIEEFKKISCVPPEEEEKLFSTILQRVKQVISDCANKMKCGCPGRSANNGSWNRAYGLLQEYLKIKINRVQCLCVLNDSKDTILPEVLDKVCNLIENDFKRLKDICTCKNNIDTHTKIVRIGEDFLLPSPTELPEKDTNTSQSKYNNCEIKNFSVTSKLSKQNSNNSMIIKGNMSSQVSPYLGMEAKSCDIMRPSSNENARTTETDHIIMDSKSNGVMYNTCDCCYNTDKVDILKFPDMFGNKEVLVNLYTEQAVNTSDIYDIPIGVTDQETSRYLLASGVESMKPIPKIETSENYENNLDAQKRVVNIRNPRAPYIGYTVDCSCDGALGSCFCMKSVVQSKNDKIDSIWKGFLVNTSTDFSYIMHGTQNKKSDVDVNCNSIPVDVLIDKTSSTAVLNDDVLTCEAEILAENVEDLVLKCSRENVNLTQNASNIVDENSSLETAYSNSDFNSVDWIKSPLPVISGRSLAVKLTNSIYFPGMPIDNDQNYFFSGTTTDFDTQRMSESCVCDKVPICHVKMLVEHIEKNLVESKCTCDSLISKVCPVHSKFFNP